ncbi:MAG TPA: outer membrane lipoprotein carrier protein LolA [Deltaproteobacteria bacterium]|nr:outer membrane lipoprotein carrier protein LolA [Deltaproteobacteria bacterium]
MRGNWKNSLALIIVMLSAAGLAHAAELGAIQKRYSAVQDFTATFTQETFQMIANKTITFEGSVSYKKNAGVRMDVQAPERQILILKGSTVLVILPAQGTSQVQELPKEIAAQNILGFFTGLASLEEYYTVQTVNDHLVLLPKTGSGSISVWTDKDTLIRRILLKDAMGNSSDIRLSAYRFNRGLPDSLFRQDETPDQGKQR